MNDQPKKRGRRSAQEIEQQRVKDARKVVCILSFVMLEETSLITETIRLTEDESVRLFKLIAEVRA